MSTDLSSQLAASGGHGRGVDPARRMMVTTIVITAVIAAAVGVWRLVNRDGDPDRRAIGEWDSIVLVDRATGSIHVADRDGTTRVLAPPVGATTAMLSVGNTVALVNDDGVTTITIDDGSHARRETPSEPDNAVSRLSVGDRLVVAIGNPITGGELTILDGTSTIEVGRLSGQAAPRLFPATLRHNADATRLAVADANNFQTILVEAVTGSDLGVGPAVSYFPDQPVAVGDEFVLTSQVVDQQAELTLHDGEGVALTTVTGELPAGAVIADDGTVVVVSIHGTITRFGPDDDQPTQVGLVAVPLDATVTGVYPVADGDRLLVVTSLSQAVIELDGRAVAATTFETPVVALTPLRSWHCIPVGGGSGFTVLVDADDGEQLADLRGLVVTGTSADGCTVIGTRDGLTEVVNADGIVKLGRLRTAVLSPDGTAIVLQTTDGETQLRDVEVGEEITTLAVPLDARYEIGFVSG